MRILLVEDDELLAQTISDVLAQQHYAVDMALDGETGWQFAIATDYDLLLLDVMLPKLDGVSLCQQLRHAGYQMPILLLTARDNHTDKVMGLDAGADDYVTKPVEFDELTARIRALLRRGSTSPSPCLTWAALSLDPSSLEVTYGSQPVHLTATELRLLELFLRHPQRVFSRNAIVDHVWAFGDQPDAASVKTYIKNLRQKLKAVDASADLIETVYGLGYRLKPEPDSSGATASLPANEPVEINAKEQQTLLAVTKARESFKTQIRDRLNILRQAVGGIDADKLDIDLYKQARHEAHRFAGALGTFGFATASQLAEEIEDLLQERSLNPQQVQQIRQLVEQLIQELEQPLVLTDKVVSVKSVFPQLLVISQDQQWLQLLTKAAETHPITITPVLTFAKNNWLEQTLCFVQNKHPDVVLLDIDAAPFAQVMALLTALFKQFSLPVLTATESDNFNYRVEVSRQGGHRFLLKTASTVQILDQVLQAFKHSQTGAARILVVDDDLSTLERVRDILEPWGLQLNLLSDPQHFWQTLVTFSPDLLVLDVEIPDLSGIDLCRVVRIDPNWSGIPVLFLTSRGDTETVHQLFAVGADDCIPKPVSGAKLLTRILNRLARSQWHNLN